MRAQVQVVSSIDKGNLMKQAGKKISLYLILLATISMLGGCGGYARSPISGSGVEMYGTVDVGVTHGRTN
jgi:Na+/H+ antiporter NhaC